MDSKIRKGKNEFKKGNFHEALNYFKQVESNHEYYAYAQLYVANSLMELKEYGDALEVIDCLITENPYNKLAWFNRALCHIFLKDKQKAFETIDSIVGIIDEDDKYDLVFVAKLYKLLEDYDAALKYCDDALALDETFKDALFEKVFIAVKLDDAEIINQVSEMLFNISDDNLLGLLPIFLLKLFSKDYLGCRDLIENYGGEKLGEDYVKMLKAIVYQQICEDLSIKLLIVNGDDVSLDEALNALFEFVEHGKADGEIRGVQYFIL